MREMMTLREAMNQLFDDSFTRPISMSGGSALPAVDLYQDSDNVFVKAVLPGVKPGDVQISVTADVLSLRGEFSQESEQKEVTYHIREQRYGSFERSIRLPTDVQTDKAKAEFENGILTVTLPKAEAVKPKSISIQAK
jgi:HSP20 family protein